MTHSAAPALLLLDLRAALAAVVGTLCGPFRMLRERVRNAWWSSGHYASRVRWFACCARFDRHRRIASRNAVARHTFETLTGRRPTRDHAQAWARKEGLDRAMYFRNPSLDAELQRCADRLSEAVEHHRHAGPVVLAPLHMLSNLLAARVCAMLPERRVTIAAVHVTGALGPGEGAVMAEHGIEPLDVRDNAAMRTQWPRVLRAVRRGERHLAIYPDILPEFTTAAARRAMRTKPARMFDRNARLHCGVDAMAGALEATALVFHLVEDRGAIDIRIHAVPHTDVADGVPRVVEGAIRDYPESWLLWHYGSAFYYNAGPA